MAKRAAKAVEPPKQPAPDKDPETGRFLPGNSGFSGRPKGSRNKLGEEFIQKLYEDFQAHGPKVVEDVRKSKPDAYLKVIASILPKELNVKVSELEEMTDEQIDRRIRDLLTETLASFGAGGAADREETAH